CQQYYSFPP
nr:immunoglobulin light chain junction region [Homo sapiens]